MSLGERMSNPTKRYLTIVSYLLLTALARLSYAEQAISINIAEGGSVTSAPAGINCNPTCNATFDDNATVVLTAIPDTDYSFLKWSGDCLGTEPQFSLTIDSAKNCTAIFLATGKQALTLTKTGEGTITSDPAGVNCGETCLVAIDENATLSLTATPANNWRFDSWSGDCTAEEPTITLTMDNAKNCSALFKEGSGTGSTPMNPNRFSLTVTKTGVGNVTSDPPGIDCGTICQIAFDQGRLVTLTAIPSAGATFSGWSGHCTGTDASTQIVMTEAKSCSALFEQTASATGLNFAGAVVDGVDGVIGLNGASAVTLGGESEQHVYVTGFFANAIAVFNRDAQTGQLTFDQVITNGVNDISGLQGANAIAVSPDQKHVYVTGTGDNALVVFTRHLTTGQLTLVEIQKDGIKGLESLAGASQVAISPDGTMVYITAPRDNAITAFQRNANTGVLTLHHTQSAVNGLQGAIGVAISPDNAFVYVTGSHDNAVSVFTRDLAFVASYRQGIEVPDGLGGAYGVVLSPNNLYVVGTSSLVSFQRDPVAGTLTHLQTLHNNLDGVQGLAGARAVAINPQGDELYVAGTNADALVVFSRDVNTGLLTFARAFRNEVGSINQLGGVTAVTTSADGAQVYTAALFSHAVSWFSAQAADLSITSGEVTTVAVNSPLTYTFTVNNQGPEQTTAVVVMDELPANTTFVSATSSQGQECVYEIQNHTVSCLLGTIEANASASITIEMTTPADVGSGVLVNQAVVSSAQPDPQSSNNTVTQNTALVAELAATDLQVVATASPADSVSINSALTYSVTVTNAGPKPANNIVVTNTLPQGVTFVSATEASGTPCTHVAGVVTCTVDTKNVNEQATITIQVTSPATEDNLTFNVQVNATETELTPENNATSVQTTVSNNANIDLAVVDAVATPNSVNIGDNLTVTIDVTNSGTATANAVTLQTALPVQVGYLSDDSGCTHENGQLTCAMGTLVTNETKQVIVQLSATAPTQPTGQPAQTVPITATVTGTDANNDNNTRTVPITITGALADFVVRVDDGGNAVLVNTAATLTITAHNNGPSATAATVNAVLTGENVAIDSITASNGTCTTGMTFNCSFDLINGGQAETITLTVTPTTVGTLTLRAELVGDGLDPTLPNVATLETAVTDSQADLAITLASEPIVGATNRPLAYTITVNNRGTNRVTGVKVTQQLPTGVTFVSAESSQGESCTQEVDEVICLLGPLEATGTATIFVNITPDLPGTLSSQASVRSDLFDPNQTNNTASLQTEVTETTTDLQVSLTSAPNPTVIDSELTYTVEIQSVGEDSTDVVLTHTLPAHTVFLSTHILPEGVGRCERVSGSQEMTCRFNLIRQSTPVSVQVMVQPTAAGELTSTATVQGAVYDPDTANNTATAVTQVNNLATLFFTETVRNGLDGVQGLEGVTSLAVSPDGQHLYATGFTSNAVAVFKRDVTTGHLDFVQAMVDGANGIAGLAGANAVALSPDGNTVYVCGFNDSAIAVFSRDQMNGTLTFVDRYQDDLDGVDGLSGAYALAISANHVYVAGLGDDAIAHFSRLPDGRLTFIAMQQADSLDAVNALTLSPDGLHLYAVSANSDSLTVFARDAGEGTLTLVQTEQDTANGLDGASAVTVSPDGLQVFTTGSVDNAVSIFNRDLNSGQVTFVQVLRDGAEGISGLAGADAVAVSPDGSTVYVVAQQDHALSVFRRTATGLNFIDALYNGVEGVTGLAGARDVALSPSGEYLYVAGFSDNAIGIVQVAHADLSLAIRDSQDPINVGDDVTVTFTVINNGPHPARQVVLSSTLPTTVKPLSFTPNQGDCTLAAGNLNCVFGTLEPSAVATLTLIVTANNVGELETIATVNAEQFDPSAPNRTVETTQVVATADINLVIEAKPSLVTIDAPLEILLILTNYGPDTAEAVVLTSELPPEIRFNTAQIAGNPTENCQWENETSTVTCRLTNLASGTSRTISLLVDTVAEGVIAVNVAVTSAAFDPELPNNSASQTLEITQKIIENTHDNTGQTLGNYIITTSGAVIGGALAGQIVNEGHLSDVWITPDTLVSGGGALSGTITNNGIIESAKLRDGASVVGGILRGTIIGSVLGTSTVNAVIEAGTTLESVTIALGSEVHPEAVLGMGVRFAANQTIPAGIDLTKTLPIIVEPIGQRMALNLSYDVLLSGDNLLIQINNLPDLRLNELVFFQDSETGHLSLPLGNELAVLVPTAVRQRTSEQVGIYTFPDGRVEFVTQTGRVITAQPALQEASALQSALAELGLLGFTTQSIGNLTIVANDQLYFAVRPNQTTQMIEAFIPLGLETVSSPLAKNLTQYIVRYLDKEGIRRQQFLYPAAAHQKALAKTLLELPGVNTVTFHNNGTVTISIGEQTYTAVFDYLVTPGAEQAGTQLLTIPDQNADGQEDIKIIYTNGDQQIAYLIPLPDWVAEIQAIPTLQAEGTLAVTDSEGHLRLMQGNTWMLMHATRIEPISKSEPPVATFFADGQAMFIIASGRQILTQPLVQASATLNMELATLGFTTVVIDEENGHLWVAANQTTGFSARPAVTSTLAPLTRPLGLNSIPSSLPGVARILFVFRDKTGSKREQFLYPTAKAPLSLYEFFMNIPTVVSVVFQNNGQLIVTNGETTWKGLFAYAVTQTGGATGGIQFTTVSDQNGDELEDFEVVYRNGEKQIIYQVP